MSRHCPNLLIHKYHCATASPHNFSLPAVGAEAADYHTGAKHEALQAVPLPVLIRKQHYALTT